MPRLIHGDLERAAAGSRWIAQPWSAALRGLAQAAVSGAGEAVFIGKTRQRERADVTLARGGRPGLVDRARERQHQRNAALGIDLAYLLGFGARAPGEVSDCPQPERRDARLDGPYDPDAQQPRIRVQSSHLFGKRRAAADFSVQSDEATVSSETDFEQCCSGCRVALAPGSDVGIDGGADGARHA